MNNMANFFLSNDSVHIYFSVLVVGFMFMSVYPEGRKQIARATENIENTMWFNI